MYIDAFIYKINLFFLHYKCIYCHYWSIECILVD